MEVNGSGVMQTPGVDGVDGNGAGSVAPPPGTAMPGGSHPPL